MLIAAPPQSPVAPSTATTKENAFRNVQTAANKGHDGAQFQMGVIFEKGLMKQNKDLKEAVRWYSMSAAQDNSRALVRNFSFFWTISQFERPLTLISIFNIVYFTLNIFQVNLGRMYQLGHGVDPDDAVAVRYFQKGSLNGDDKSTFNLAMCYKRGTGVAVDVPKSIELLGKAADQGSTAAKFHLGLLLERGEIGVVRKIIFFFLFQI